ncbi:hypothetical protein JCM11251_006363 [Rhodosporidiobolus azoricus]
MAAPSSFLHSVSVPYQPQSQPHPIAASLPTQSASFGRYSLYSSPSNCSLLSCTSDSEVLPYHFGTFPSASGAQRRPLADRVAREKNGPYSRKSSLLSSAGAEEQVKLPPFLSEGIGGGLGDRMAGLAVPAKAAGQVNVEEEEVEKPLSGTSRSGRRYTKRTKTPTRLNRRHLQSGEQSCVDKAPFVRPSQASTNTLSKYSGDENDSTDLALVGPDSYEETQAALAEATAAVSSAPSAKALKKARSTFVQTWLSRSYKITEGSSIARQALYDSYVEASQTLKVKPLNSAAFGKAAKQAFPTLKTRRFGTRGHSRYHLMNLAATNSVEAAQVKRIDEELEAQRASTDKETLPVSSRAKGSEAEEMNIPELSEREVVRSSSRRSNLRSLSISTPPPGATNGGSAVEEQKTLIDLDVKNCLLAAVPSQSQYEAPVSSSCSWQTVLHSSFPAEPAAAPPQIDTRPPLKLTQSTSIHPLPEPPQKTASEGTLSAASSNYRPSDPPACYVLRPIQLFPRLQPVEQSLLPICPPFILKPLPPMQAPDAAQSFPSHSLTLSCPAGGAENVATSRAISGGLIGTKRAFGGGALEQLDGGVRPEWSALAGWDKQ